MRFSIFKQALAGALLPAAVVLALAPASALAAGEHPSVKRLFSLPPSADLQYSIRMSQRGFQLNGDGAINWRVSENSYSIVSESHAPLFGKVLDSQSEGTLDAFGLAPASFHEKRFRKEATTTTFLRDSKRIVFGESQESYPLTGGEQDRSSAPWQLVAVARGAPDKFTPGSEWSFFVAGARDAERWTFKVIGRETVRIAQGEVDAVHLVKAPPPDNHGQQVDIWLAPSLEWYPVRLRFSDNDSDFIEQTLLRISRK